jgi:hypothetical protein
MTEKDIKKRAHTAAYKEKVASEKFHNEVTTSLEQLEHPAEKKGAPKVTGHTAGSKLKKK